MAFIIGYGYIPAISVTGNGNFFFQSNPAAPSWYITPPASGPMVTGELTYIYDCAGTLELFNSDGNTPMGIVEVIRLPSDFQITSIAGNSVHGFLYQVPTPGIIEQDADNSWDVSGIASTVPSWDGKPETWDPAFQDDLYDPFTISYTVASATHSVDLDPLVFGDDLNATLYEPEVGYPTNVLRFFFTGTFDTGDIPEKPTDPEFTPYPDAITVTPGEGTEDLVVEVPGEPDQIIPVTPGVRVEIALPPGATVVTITPTGPGGSGPRLIVPVAMNDQDEGFVLDVATSSVIFASIDPSGIYTLVPGKLFDTLYERSGATVTSQNVPIPTPFARTSFIPEED